AGRLERPARAVQGRDGEGHRPGRPPVAGAGEAPAGPGERLQRWRRGDRAEPQTTLDGAGRQALRPVRHRPEGDGVPRQGGRGRQRFGLIRGLIVATRRRGCALTPPPDLSQSRTAILGKEATMTETAEVIGIEDALRQCGVTETTLAPGEKDALDRHGYLVWPDLLDPDWLARLRAAFETALRQGQRHGA